MNSSTPKKRAKQLTLFRPCTRCGTEKPPTTDNFHVRASGHLASWCRECHRLYYQARRRERASSMMAQQAKQTTPIKVLEIYQEGGFQVKRLQSSIGFSA